MAIYSHQCSTAFAAPHGPLAHLWPGLLQPTSMAKGRPWQSQGAWPQESRAEIKSFLSPVSCYGSSHCLPQTYTPFNTHQHSLQHPHCFSSIWSHSRNPWLAFSIVPPKFMTCIVLPISLSPTLYLSPCSFSAAPWASIILEESWVSSSWFWCCMSYLAIPSRTLPPGETPDLPEFRSIEGRWTRGPLWRSDPNWRT